MVRLHKTEAFSKLLNLEQSQKQIISQKAIQSVQILQMSSQELAEYVKDAAMENPVIDLDGGEGGSDGAGEAEDKDKLTPQEDDRIRKIEWLASLDEQNRTYYQFDRDEAEQENGYENLAVRGAEKLEDFLHMQLLGQGYSDTEEKVFEYVIQNIDSNGFFKISLSETALINHVSEDCAAKCLKIMRNLEPYGVCAASVRDCLLRQIEMREDTRETEREIVLNYMDLLSKNQLPLIARKMKCRLSEVIRAAGVIRDLNPRPAQGFDNGEQLHYVVPDITVVKLEDRFEILVNTYSCPPIHISRDYLNMLRSDCEKDVREYLLDKIQQAENIRDFISRRNKTLLELGECIVNVQHHFFLTGDSTLRPLRLADVAEILQCHESTVSRALKDKYLQCCWGVYPLSFFFPKGLGQSEDGEGLAVTEVRKKLKDVIDHEDKEKPYSDQALADILNRQGVEISRRTVAKYRDEMNIPSTRGRKSF